MADAMIKGKACLAPKIFYVILTNMGLAAEDLNYIKSQFNNWVSELDFGEPPTTFEMELRERIVRVEEELKHQRELIHEILKQMDLRFEAVNKRFEAVDKRFEDMNKRFEDMNKRFEGIDKRLEAMQTQMDQRFEMLTRRIDRFMFWSFSLTVASAGTVIAVLKFL